MKTDTKRVIPTHFEGVPLNSWDSRRFQWLLERGTPIDFSDLLDIVRIIVAHRGPDYVYQNHFGENCRNFVNGAPACIMGSVFYLLGLNAVECGVDGSLAKTLMQLKKTAPDVVFTDGFFRLGRILQGMQDNRVPYGAVCEAATHFSQAFFAVPQYRAELSRTF